MSDFQQLWDSAEGLDFDAKPQEFRPFVKGKYTAKIDDAMLDLTSTPNRVTFKFKVTEGEYANRVLWRNISLDERGIPYLKQDLQKLHVETTPQKEEDLGDILSQLTDKEISIFVKPNIVNDKQYDNVYINGYKNDADKVEGAAKRDEPSFDADESLPF